MTPAVVFLVQTFCVLVLPVAMLRLLRIHGWVPLVVAQIVVGIALGPSFFGKVVPDAYHALFNASALTPLSGIANLGVLIFGFITGVHLDTRMFRGRGGRFLFIACCAIGVPGLFGFWAGEWIAASFPAEISSKISPLEFAAAISICTSVVALPVLGAILHDMKLLGHRIGQIALGIAAINDVSLWVALGVLLAAVTGGAETGARSYMGLILLPLQVLLMLAVVRPLLKRIEKRLVANGRLNEAGLMLLFAVALGSATATEAMGLHLILGAFLAGLAVPDGLRQPVLDRIQVMTIGVLLPYYFMLTGLKSEINFASSSFLYIFAISLAVAVVGKAGATALSARITGESWPNALGLGALLQTKGLMEVIILTILLDDGIVSINVFSAFIATAVITTAFAAPLAHLALSRAPGIGPADQLPELTAESFVES